MDGETGIAAPIDDRSLGVPEGVLARARSLLALAGITETRSNHSPSEAAAGDTATDLLTAPQRLEADWPDPPDAVPVGDGWVHAELVDDDRGVFEELRHSRVRGAEELAVVAQELRLPVTPFRSLPTARPTVRSPAQVRPPVDRARAAGALIIDLSTHWAGPLATELLARAGASVIKVDPSCRPDGFGGRPRLHHHLNGSKEIIDLDLRVSSHRARFEHLVASADLVVESFSRRVMGNFGYGPCRLRTIGPNVCTLSIRAFPADCPEADWIGYGPGVHAASGLGMRNGRPWTASVAYPDLLTGLEGFVTGLSLLAERERPTHSEVTLLDSIDPLLHGGAHG